MVFGLEQELGSFHLAIERYQKFSMAGWIPTPVPTGNVYAVFMDMLASSGERRELVESPVKEVVPSPVRPSGWRRVESVFGRIHYQHSVSSLGIYRHPSGSARVNQSTGYSIISFTADHGDRSGRCSRWILDESTRVPPNILPLTGKEKDHDTTSGFLMTRRLRVSFRLKYFQDGQSIPDRTG